MKKKLLEIRAGRRAYEHIMANGLSPEDVRMVFGASGAAKWLSIAGLDSAIFGDWLDGSQHPIDVFGTSVGAIKLVAAMQADPKARIADLSEAYIQQRYEQRPSADEIQRQGERILDAALGDDGIRQLLEHPHYRYHCGAVLCEGALATAKTTSQALALSHLALLNLVDKSRMSKSLKRVILSAPAAAQNCAKFRAADGFTTLYCELNKNNLREAVRASGSIPIYMHGVDWLEDDYVGDERRGNEGSHSNLVSGVLRDGGLLDYHPSPSNFDTGDSGLVLYPHFFSRIVETWFDKFLPWRHLPEEKNDNVVLLCPSQEYIDSIRLQRIPDRADFSRYMGKDDLRMELWREATQRSYQLGEEWLECVESQSWDQLKRL